MKDYGIVESTVKPEFLKIDEYSVWISTDITPIAKDIGEGEFVVFQYRLRQYDKDEYILMQQATVENQITDTQLALCEIYESLR